MTVKKLNISWSIWNIGASSSKRVVAIQNAVKGLATFVTGCTYIASNANYALISGALFYYPRYFD